MSEQTAQPENDSPQATPQAAQPRPGGKSWLARVGMTQIALAALALIFLWQWWTGHRAINDMQQQLAKKIAELDAGSRANQILLAQNQEQARELSAKLAGLETSYGESHNQRAALDSLYAGMSESRDESALAEVEQMLLSATQQLQLSANVKVAMIAMQSADARLQRMNRPAFDPLRKAIGQDIDKLRALPDVDIAGFGRQLDALMASVDDLTLAYEQRPAPHAVVQAAPPQDETYWQSLLREIGQEMKQLVRIENTGKDEIPLLPPNQEFFLRENLKLRLMSARLALMSRDEELFRHDLKAAQLWTARYFEGKSNESLRMMSGLKKLAASRIDFELPDISSSLQAVRNYRLKREHGPRAPSSARSKAVR